MIDAVNTLSIFIINWLGKFMDDSLCDEDIAVVANFVFLKTIP